MTKIKILGSIALFAGLAQCTFAAGIYSGCVAFSGPSACAFSGTGIITVAGPNITWKSDALGGAADMFTFSTIAGNTSIFSTIPNGSQEGIADLTLAADPVGVVFGPNPFMSFPTGPLNVAGSALLINFISPGIDPVGPCTAPPAAASGQTCTPQIAPGVPGPFNFANFVDPIFGLSSTATFGFSGVSADGSGKWSAIFTSQFQGQSFQSVIAQLNSTGSVSNSYSQATLVVTAATPEPGSLFMIGSGLIGLAAFMRRRAVK